MAKTAGQVSVGVAHHNYQTRVIYDDLHIPGVRYVDVKFKPFPYRLMNRGSSQLSLFTILSQSLGRMAGSADVDLYHSYNRILFNKNKPWVISFESLLPRTWFNKCINAPIFSILGRDECRAVLAMSENAKLHMIDRNHSHPKLVSVLEKTHIIHPGVHDFPELYRLHLERKIENEIHIAFIGNDFFRKGGTIAVSIIERLKKKYPLKFTVVSKMSKSVLEKKSIALSAPGNVDEWKSRIVNAGGTLLSDLPYHTVRGLLTQVDILLLPTLDDSFGFSIVEAMATGVVNVATRIRAIPEIITHGLDGLLIDVETTREGRLDLSKTAISDIENKMETILKDLLDNPDQLNEMSRNARRSYEKKFTRACLTKKLQAVYTSAI